MAYKTIYNGLAAILATKNLAPSLQADDFDDAPDSEYENTFILKCESGEQSDENEQQSALLYDNQKWSIQIAYSKSSQSEIEQRDLIQAKKDELIIELDDPANWRSFCTLLRYRTWSLQETDSYYLLNIELKIKDALAY